MIVVAAMYVGRYIVRSGIGWCRSRWPIFLRRRSFSSRAEPPPFHSLESSPLCSGRWLKINMQKAYFCIVLIDGGPIPDVVGNTSLVPVKGRSTPKTQRVSYQNWQWISGRIFCQYSIPIRSDLNFINEIGPFSLVITKDVESPNMYRYHKSRIVFLVPRSHCHCFSLFFSAKCNSVRLLLWWEGALIRPSLNIVAFICYGSASECESSNVIT